MKKVALISVVILIFLFLFSTLKLTKKTEELKDLKAGYLVIKEREEAAQERFVEEIRIKNEHISKLNNEIKGFNKTIEKAKAYDKVQNEKIKQLEKEKEALASSGDLPGVILNLENQVEAWKERFALSQLTIGEKDKIIVNLNSVISDYISSIELWKQKYESEARIREESEKVFSELEGMYRRLKRQSKIRTLVEVALAGGFAYCTFLKK